jgi:carotenoid cleavage dioxygenase
MVSFPNLPMYMGINAPGRAELDIDDLEVVHGSVPKEIDGSFYRAAADHQFASRFDNDIPFNGDGMISMFRFGDGKVGLKTRYARTDRWKAEHEAGRRLFGKYRNRFTDDPAVVGVERALANTNVILHGGVLLALWEGAKPFALDPVTLESIGNWDFHGTLPGPTCSAHCAVDSVTGNLVGFGFAAKGEFTTDTVYFEVSPEGRVIHQAWFQLPYFAELHDCGVTQDYICFPLVPIIGCGDERLKAGETYYGWDPEREIYLGAAATRSAGSRHPTSSPATR